ncbi:N-6 DNA methylase [Streptomyces sp. NPDC048603]|uniref:N-6 DNA methylase n=1 Tax=Streptomyces sp. NPDC048603 TaxID=3365577 RepID=UPI00371FA7FE
MTPPPAGPSAPSAQVTAAEISRIAGVTRATVSNWRRRHEDFPSPAGGTESSPLYDLHAVQDWLRGRGHSSNAAPDEELRTALRLTGPGSGIAARLVPLVLAASQRTPAELDQLGAAPDEELVVRAHQAADRLPSAVPTAGPVAYGPQDAAAIRALLACVRAAGPPAALDVLAERELEEGTAGGTYQTPEGLASLMAGLLPDDAASVFDPACGSGGFLVAAARRGVRELYGQDILAVQAQRTAVRLLLTGADEGVSTDSKVSIQPGDSLRTDAFPDLTADAVLTNPPFGDRDWGHEELAYDPRWAYGVPTRFESELAWVQHALAHLRPGGHAVMVMPPAVAFRVSGRRIRAELARSGALRAVVSLPVGAAHPLHIGLHVWVLQRPEPGGAEHTSVLFVNGEGDQAEPRGTRGGSRTRQEPVDWAELTARVLVPWQAYEAAPNDFTDVQGIARAVPVVDLLDDLVDLTPARHVRVSAADVPPMELARQVSELRAALSKQLTALSAAVGRDDWRPAESPAGAADTWRTATVSDLTRGGALTLFRGAVPAPARDTASAPDGRLPGDAPPRVLTSGDVAAGTSASGTVDRLRTDPAQAVTVAAGDVVVRGDVHAGSIGRTMARVAEESDAGSILGPHLHLLRPDPNRLDPWFLAGFLGAADNIAAASTGTTIVHVNPGRLRVPLLPLDEQRRYGKAFRQVHVLRRSAARTAQILEEVAGAMSNGLTVGALLPPPADA